MNPKFNISSSAYFTNSKNKVSIKSTENKSLRYDFSNNLKTNDVFTLAKAFLSISRMTNKKLQKLCYYAKAWYLAIYDNNIISEQFQAWVHGAVQPALYQQYKRYGFSEIPQFKNVTELPEEFISFAREIYSAYGHLSGDELEKINHEEEPWIKARGNCKPWEACNKEICEDDMKSYYRKMMM